MAMGRPGLSRPYLNPQNTMNKFKMLFKFIYKRLALELGKHQNNLLSVGALCIYNIKMCDQLEEFIWKNSLIINVLFLGV